MYYYGARYFNPRLSIWYAVDPIAIWNPVMESEFYGDGEHNEGVFYWGNLNPYIYTYQNPIVYIDPNGKQNYFMPPPDGGKAFGSFFIGVGRACRDAYNAAKWQLKASYTMSFGSPSEMMATAKEMNATAKSTGKYLASGQAMSDASTSLQSPEGWGYVAGTGALIYLTRKAGGFIKTTLPTPLSRLLITPKGINKVIKHLSMMDPDVATML